VLETAPSAPDAAAAAGTEAFVVRLVPQHICLIRGQPDTLCFAVHA
jgi:hypothetical protein